jgi:hypothetical protein
MRARSAVAISAAVGLLAGCSGQIGDVSGGTNGGAATRPGSGGPAGMGDTAVLTCTRRPTLGAENLRVLGRREYEASLREVFGDAALDSAASQLAQLSDKKVLHGFRSMAQGTTGADVESYFMIADALAAYVTSAPDKLSALAPCLSAASVARDCAKTFIETFGRRLYRRPLAPDEVTYLLTVHSDGAAISAPDGIRFALFAMLQSPHFLYRIETAGAAVAASPGTYQLTAYEVATRLSYLAWGTAPDVGLLDSAASGGLDTTDGLDRELDRLLSDAKARTRLGQFFAEWLETEDLPAVNQSPEFLAGISSMGLASAMQDELSETALYLMFDGQGTYKDLFTSPLSFVKSPDLAKLYGIQPGAASDGRTSLDVASRGGLVSRAAILLTSGEQTSPIRRGAFVRRKLLCDPIAPPDPNSFPPGAIQPPAFNAMMTSRQRWTAKTTQGGCAACHGSINPPGFALENYDSIGRYRATEAIVDPMTGMKVNDLPIDSNVDMLLDGTTPTHVESGVGLGAALGASATAQECFGRQWFRFVTGREESAQDGCVVGDIVDATKKGATIKDAFKRIALAPEFRLRKVEGN